MSPIIELPHLDEILLDRAKPLQQQLYRQLHQLILQGRLRPGFRLPSSRRLAETLGVSRNTVTLVLEQLKQEGFLISRVGSGCYVNRQLPQDCLGLDAAVWESSVHPPELSLYAQGLEEYRMRADADEGSADLPFTVGLPDLTCFPAATWSRILRRHSDRTCLMGFDDPMGYPPLREALSNYLAASRGVRCKPEQVLITQGAQQALALCALVLLNPGEQVLVENPGYAGAREALLARGAKLEPLPMGPQGVDTAALPSQTEARLMYCTPTHQYPLGGILSAAQRLQLLDWAASQRLWIIEDDYDSEFHFHAKPIAALQGMAPHTPVIYMGSFSKTLLPASRLGYLVVPESLANTFATAKRYQGGDSPMLLQAAAADFIAEGHFVRHLRRMRQCYQRKWDHIHDLLIPLAGRVESLAESAGMHLVLQIDGVDDRVLCRAFHEQGFGGTPLSSYYLEGTKPRQGIVLGFAHSSRAEREDAVAVLKQLLESGVATASHQ
ncbi:PLP-dependent aminotransferase family protein [Motiliproteus coralliicola]|uniref:PLP-dependent aminotransferase family protein n=1 Tax=Motiliproteus coralliicola TaxID=2283196 RepID=A0A369WNV5_9GAMM|nr:PLP-dependent aminotransferase family protein [Motiliproteus coralliicola]RDE22749.1 PLP-dependent aminotransferase family protein [Motiliproteus coralliicola]